MLPRNICDYLTVVTTPFLISENLHELQHHPDARSSNVPKNTYVAGIIQLDHAFARVSSASIKLHQFACNSALAQTNKACVLQRENPKLHNTSFASGSEVILVFYNIQYNS